jgi:hypothetical protein
MDLTIVFISNDRSISADVTDDTLENYACGSLCCLNLTIVLDFLSLQDNHHIPTLMGEINYINTYYETGQKSSQKSRLFTRFSSSYKYILCFTTIAICCIYLLNLVDNMFN